MRILHYFLGFPPYRTGGLTKYAFDLMDAQAQQGNSVIALWPGQIRFLSKKVKIEKRNNVNNILNYEVINPLPVSLDEGIKVFDEYMKECDYTVYKRFLISINPDVIHIHTLMGLHKEFIDAAKELNIRTVFTTHDYFGVCPKVTLYRYGIPCDNDMECKNCIQCNYKALSINKIQIMQSLIYRKIKNLMIIKMIRKKHRMDFFEDEIMPTMTISRKEVLSLAENYKKLRAYYIYMFETIDLIHFNSKVSESIYNRYLTPKSSCVMNITHKDIIDNREANEWKRSETLRITLLAPAKPFKGFNVLKTALDELWNSGIHNFNLKVFGHVKSISPYMEIQEDGFKYSQLKLILADTDILVAPSIWYETFGFTVLEAISYGVPVIVSENVGAKDIVGDGGIVVKSGDVNELKNAIQSLNFERLEYFRQNIKNREKIKTWQQFVDENYKLYSE